MAVFKYTGRSRSGEKVEGEIEAQDRRSALVMIEQRGHLPVAVTEKSAAATDISKEQRKRFKLVRRRKNHLSVRDVLTFTTELSDLLASGMTLGNALNSLARRKTGKAVDDVSAGLRDEIVRGASLSEALARYPDTFPALYVSMIKAGEAGGALPVVLRRLVDHYERILDTREKIVMALVYPLIVLVMGMGTMIFSMVFVVPKFENVFAALGESLPLSTRMLMAMSRGLTHYGWAILVVIGVLVVLIQRVMQTEHGKLWWHDMQLRLPLIRGVVASDAFANFARTLETLLVNGVHVISALGIVERTVTNKVIAREVHKARERVTDGATISRPMAAGKIFPQLMTDMLAVGEETGDVAGALAHIARRYENELNRNLKIFTTALEPILIVLVAIMVGFVAVSIMMAVFSLTSGLGV